MRESFTVSCSPKKKVEGQVKGGHRTAGIHPLEWTQNINLMD
jgi:hypothetical protein